MTDHLFFKKPTWVLVLGLCVLGTNLGAVHAEDMVVEATPPSVDATIEPVIQAVSEVNVLSEEAIRAFYKESVDVQLTGAEETLEFLDKHTHADAKSILHIRTLIQGQPPKKENVITSKEDVLSDTKAAYEKGHISHVNTDILSIDIAEGGQSATISERTQLDFTMPSSSGDQVSVKSKQSCDTALVLTDKIIQTKNSECDVEVNVKIIK